MDLESDFGLYVGRVRHRGVLNNGMPSVLIRKDGLVA